MRVFHQCFLMIVLLTSYIICFLPPSVSAFTVAVTSVSMDQPNARSYNRIHHRNGIMKQPKFAPQRNIDISQLPMSPSGIDQWPQVAQTAVFFGVYGLLGAATVPTVTMIDSLSKSMFGLERWRNWFVDTSLPLALGIFYSLAGSGHFLAADAFCDIYPPKGTWGIWYLPGSASFHVAWTGLVELFGGAGLLLGVVARTLWLDQIEMQEDNSDAAILKLIQPFSAAMLLALTLIVTPANIYMYTHGAIMGAGDPLDLSFHYIRFAMQVLLLSLLFVLAKDSFFYAWGDELD